MIAVTAFDVVSGFRCQHFFRFACDSNGERFQIGMLEDIVKLANDELVLQRSMYPVYLVTRRATYFGVLTWVCKYEIVPDKYFGRNGSYFGLGVWFLNSILDGVEV